MKLNVRVGVVVLLFFICSNQTLAQLSNIQGIDNVVIRTRKYDDIRGSAYLYPEWSAGTLTDKNGKAYANLQLKYDTYSDRIELNQDGQVLEINSVAYPQFTLSVVQPGSNSVVKHSFSTGYNVPGFSVNSYFDVLKEGGITVLKKFKTSFVEENVSSYGTAEQKKSFQTKALYFIVNEKKNVKETKLNRRSVLEVFPEKAQQIEDFLKKEKLKLKTENDLVKVIDFLEKA